MKPNAVLPIDGDAVTGLRGCAVQDVPLYWRNTRLIWSATEFPYEASSPPSRR